jgi:hypothetical protein
MGEMENSGASLEEGEEIIIEELVLPETTETVETVGVSEPVTVILPDWSQNAVTVIVIALGVIFGALCGLAIVKGFGRLGV